MKDAAYRNTADLPSAGDLGQIHARPNAEAAQEGSCNFCNNFSISVHVLSGRHLMVRLCPSCWESAKRQIGGRG